MSRLSSQTGARFRFGRRYHCHIRHPTMCSMCFNCDHSKTFPERRRKAREPQQRSLCASHSPLFTYFRLNYAYCSHGPSRLLGDGPQYRCHTHRFKHEAGHDLDHLDHTRFVIICCAGSTSDRSETHETCTTAVHHADRTAPIRQHDLQTIR